ncbi:hypothetical protein Ssed_1970 [Shewanella sediminis HAW-EB3]|uniref:Uncharacterized protein n=1 Tax=Shewanella sediminis (strain HAW-EB3) TaxID=425104 RepID=A8FUQ6_SHESH|nr:hypothetical protein [Shewanella sediminis]ABV36579.1 hypothetical protein Ssed_1970 [Shewanella sediminis HAW-EB3]
MRNKKLTALILPLIWGITACGSDDNDNDAVQLPPPDEQVERNVAWDYIETPYNPFDSNELSGRVFVELDGIDDRVTKWIAKNSANLAFDLNADGAINQYDVPEDVFLTRKNGGPMLPKLEIDTEDMKQVLSSNPDGLGAGTSRPDVFVEGNYSVFDLLRYLVVTRPDMQFDSITPYQESALDTYEYLFSWDENGDGDFSNDGEYSASQNWSFTILNSNGDLGYISPGMFTYKRMDHSWLRPKQVVRFQNHSDTMTSRTRWIWEQQQQRLAANDGKFIIPQIQYLDVSQRPPAMNILATNLEVKPFNVRKDVFVEGQITSMDVWLTLAHEHDMDFRFSFWGTLSAGAMVNGFALSHDPIAGTYGGWTASTPRQGEFASANDFDQVQPLCDFGLDGTPDGEGRLTQEQCTDEWLTRLPIQGNNVAEVAGNNLHAYPPEYMLLLGPAVLAPLNGVVEVDLINFPDARTEVYVTDDMLEMADVPDAYDMQGKETAVLTAKYAATEPVGKARILDENHFGWKISDCTLCHNEEKQPLGHGGQSWPTNAVEGFDYQQPYYCATCHGANGAPKGHNRGARCFWCHSNRGEYVPQNHGDASVSRLLSGDEVIYSKRTYLAVSTDREQKPIPFEEIESNHNSDYNMSKTYPAPYACMTCHGK